jgi:hypothetical protein
MPEKAEGVRMPKIWIKFNEVNIYELGKTK